MNSYVPYEIRCDSPLLDGRHAGGHSEAPPAGSGKAMTEDVTKTCMRCGTRESLRSDPHIEGVYFCADCWEEREILERAQQLGYDDEFRDEDG